MWDTATSLSNENSITVDTTILLNRRPPRSRTMLRHLQDSIVDSTIVTSRETSISEYKTQVYYSTIDIILKEMGDRFSELSLSIISALQALVPTSDTFLDLPTLSPFLSHYHICREAVLSEIPILRAFLHEKSSAASLTFHEMHTELAKVPECFPAILSCYQIALTIGVSSASAERSFSSLRRIKTYLRSTMAKIAQDRLSNLALLHIERQLSTQLWNTIDELVVRFAQLHKNSRIVLY